MVADGCDDPGAVIMPHVILSLLQEHSAGEALPAGASEKRKEVNSSKIVIWVLEPEHCAEKVRLDYLCCIRSCKWTQLLLIKILSSSD